MSKIFISYRRQDVKEFVLRIYDRLVLEFKKDNVFLDEANIKPGVLFPEKLERALYDSNTAIIVIGPNWINIKNNKGKQKLFDPNDFVCREIEIAILNNLRIFPILIDGAKMPSENELPEKIKSISSVQAIEIKNNSFHADLDKLIENLRRPNHFPLGLLTFFAALFSSSFFNVLRLAQQTDLLLFTEAELNILLILLYSFRWFLLCIATLFAIRKSFGIRDIQIVSISLFVLIGSLLGYWLRETFLYSGTPLPLGLLRGSLTYGFISLGLLIGIKKICNLTWKNVFLLSGSIFFAGAVAEGFFRFINPLRLEIEVFILAEIIRVSNMLILAITFFLLSGKALKLHPKQILIFLTYFSVGIITVGILRGLGLSLLGSSIMRWGFSSAFYYAPLIVSTSIAIFKVNELKKSI